MGIDTLRVIDTGLDPVTAEREQWDDGNNTLAIAPAAGGRLRAQHRDQRPAGGGRHRGGPDRRQRAGQRPGRPAVHVLPDQPRPARCADRRRQRRRRNDGFRRPRRRPHGRQTWKGPSATDGGCSSARAWTQRYPRRRGCRKPIAHGARALFSVESRATVGDSLVTQSRDCRLTAQRRVSWRLRSPARARRSASSAASCRPAPRPSRPANAAPAPRGPRPPCPRPGPRPARAGRAPGTSRRSGCPSPSAAAAGGVQPGQRVEQRLLVVRHHPAQVVASRISAPVRRLDRGRAARWARRPRWPAPATPRPRGCGRSTPSSQKSKPSCT